RDGSLVARLECAAELISKRTEPVRRRSIPAFGILAHFLGLVRVQYRLDAETNAATRRVEDDDLHVGADGKRAGDIRVPGNAGLAQWDETRAPRGEEHEHAELLMTLDLSRESRARHDLELRGRHAAGARRTLRNERDANPLLLEVDAQDLECARHPRGHPRGPSVRSPRGSKRGSVRQRFDPGLELDERTEVRDARHTAGAHL